MNRPVSIAKRTGPRTSRNACIALALALAPLLFAQSADRTQIRSNAIALEQQGQNAEAEQLWDSLAKTNPRDAEALAHLGLLQARQNHYGAAIDHYRQALAIDPNLPGLRMNLGLALFKAAQFPEALTYFSAELRKHPGDPRLIILLGMAHYGMKDYLVTIPYLQRAAETDPQNVALRTTLAHSCMASKQYPCVLKVHQEILSLNAESAEADLLAAEALDQVRDTAGATKALRAAIQADPKQPNVHFGLGYLLWRQSHWAEAADQFQLEIQNDPRHEKARLYLADVWLQQKEFDKALPLLEELVAQDPSEPLAHRDLGIIYEHAGRSKDAVAEHKLAIQADLPNDLPRLAELISALEAPSP